MKTTSPYKTAAELGIEQWEHDGLVALIGPLSRGELPFDMDRGFVDYQDCGTPRCIGGWMCSNAERPWDTYSVALYSLFWPREVKSPWSMITDQQAACAVVNFLTLGDPRWDDVMREPA